jgi:hypothetical protein
MNYTISPCSNSYFLKHKNKDIHSNFFEDFCSRPQQTTSHTHEISSLSSEKRTKRIFCSSSKNSGNKMRTSSTIFTESFSNYWEDFGLPILIPTIDCYEKWKILKEKFINYGYRTKILEYIHRDDCDVIDDKANLEKLQQVIGLGYGTFNLRERLRFHSVNLNYDIFDLVTNSKTFKSPSEYEMYLVEDLLLNSFLDHRRIGLVTEVDFKVHRKKVCKKKNAGVCVGYLDGVVYDRRYMNEKLRCRRMEYGDTYMQMLAARVIIEKKKDDIDWIKLFDETVDYLKGALYINPERLFIYGLLFDVSSLRVIQLEQ